MGEPGLDHQTGDPIEMIATAIGEFSNKDGKSLRQIAHYSNVAYSYIYRLANREISEDSLDPIKVFQVLKFIKGIEHAYEFSLANPKWAKKVKSWVGLPEELVKRSIGLKEIEDIVAETDESILAFILACNHNGTTEKELAEIGGQLVLYAAKYLISKEILIEKDGKILSKHLSDNSLAFFGFSRETYKRVIPLLLKHYWPSHSGQDRNFIFAGTESLSEEFIKKTVQKISELRDWYSKESVLKENLGDNPAFFTITLDTFTDKFKNEKGLLQ